MSKCKIKMYDRHTKYSLTYKFQFLNSYLIYDFSIFDTQRIMCNSAKISNHRGVKGSKIINA